MNLLNPKFRWMIGVFVFALFLYPSFTNAQNDTPCECTQRWTQGAHWNTDGSVNDAPNAPSENGIIRCGSSASTQSSVNPLSNCTYDSTAFAIDISGTPCIDPSSGLPVTAINPTNGQPIIWLNFDVRPLSGSFQVQINDNSGDVIAWGLYHSNVVTNSVSLNPNGVSTDSISGDCSQLTLVACGVESSASWNTLPVPNFLETSNYYLAIWDQTADGNLSVNNFKARFGCGGADILICNFNTDPAITTCDSNGTYTLEIPVNGINGELYAYDPASNNAGGLSAPICLTNVSSTNVTNDTLVLTYNQGVPYNVIVFEANDSLPPALVTPSGSCDDPINPEGCRDTVSGPAPDCCIVTVTATGTDALCNGDSTGTATANPLGGIAPYSYIWANGSTNQTATGLTAGTYTVITMDSLQCADTASVNIVEPSSLNVSATGTDLLCNGDSSGTTTANPSGGTTPYTYSWNNGQTTQTATVLQAGTYTVTVLDSNQCQASTSVTIGEPQVLSGNFTLTDVLCNGDSTGTLSFPVTGGTTPYSILWSNGATTEVVNGVPAGVYTVAVTDSNGCTTGGADLVDEPDTLTCSVTGTIPLCNGGSDGTATVSEAGGISPYSYVWSNGDLTATADSLSAGTYTATVTDANNCTSTCTVTIGEPTAIQINLTPTNSTCGFANGAVSATVGGGTGAYMYAWSNGASTQNINGVAAGAYSLIVTDANGCKDTAMTNVNDTGGPSVSATGTDLLCNGDSSGTTTANPSGGTTPYTYSWNNGQTTQTATVLQAGTYTVTVLDSNQCQASTSVTIGEPQVLSGNFTLTDVLCNGDSTGTLSFPVTGGTTPYSILWSNGATTEVVNGVPAGVYTVAVTDSNGCTTGGADLVDEPDTLTCSVTGTIPLCNGGSDGTATVSEAGGISPYSYVWSNGDLTATADSLSAGTYTATVTDANNCTSTCTVTIGEPTAIQINLTPTNSTCGFANGAVSATVGGGTGAYMYAWSNGASTQNINGVAAGAYSLIVTDANGCKDTAMTNVNDTGGPSVSATGTDLLCNGDSSGTTTANPSGGTTPYTYSWNNGQTTQTATVLQAGTYTVTVLDSNQCQASTSVTIGEPQVLSGNFTLTDVLCNGDSTGTLSFPVTGGTTPYSILWSNGATTEVVNGVPAGVYTVAVTDSNGCTTGGADLVDEPDTLTCSVTGTDPLCNGGADGTATVIATGGSQIPIVFRSVEIDILTDNFSVETTWELKSHITGQTHLSGGPYLNNNTLYTHSVQVPEGDSLCFTIYDTYGDGICCLQGQGYCAVSVEGVTVSVGGQFAYQDITNFRVDGVYGDPYTYQWSTSPVQTTASATGLSQGVYTVTVTDANQCTATCSVTIGEPTALNPSIIPTNTTCNGGNDGEMDLTISGGTQPYNYNWSNGDSTEDISGLNSGFYTVTITDANLCTVSISGFIGGGGDLQLSATVTDATCSGYADGSIDLSVSGGVNPYTYNWSHSSSNQDPSGLTAGNYTVTVSDSSGCQATGSWQVDEPQPVTVICSILDSISCFGGSDGVAFVNASGGTTGNNNPPFGGGGPTGGYTYMWSDGQTNATAIGLSDGTYTVTVFDFNQCSATCSVTLTEPSEIILTKVDSFCFIDFSIENYQHGAELTSVSAGDVTVSFSAVANGGKPDKVIVFDSDLSGTADPDLEVDLNNLMILPTDDIDANNDNLVDDPNDNLHGGKIILDFSDNVRIASFKYVDQDDNGPSYAKAYDGSNNLVSTITINNAGNASVQFIAMNADNVRRLEFDLVSSGAIAELKIECPSSVGQGSTGSIDLTVNGGTPNYTYLWSNSATTQDINQVPAGFYTVTVTDANNCSKTCSTLLSSPNLPIPGCQVTREISCSGFSDGEITVYVIGGTAPYSILWSTGATTNTITNCVAGPYSITVTDGNGFSVSESMVLGQPAPIDNNVTSNDPTTFCQGGSALLEAMVDPTCTYQWLKYGIPIAGANSSTYLATGTGNYKVEIENISGCVAQSGIIKITKHGRPPAAITAQGATTICPGSSVTLIANTGPGLTYEWKRRGKIVSTGSATFDAVSEGKHKVIVSDANGCIRASNSIIISRYPRPNISVNPGGNVVICQGSTIELLANPSVGPGPYAYQWYKYNNPINGETNVAYTAQNNGGYSVEIVDANGCTNKSSRTVVSNVTCSPRVIKISLNVEAYPNPFRDELNIDIQGDPDKPLHVEVLNILGEVVYERDYANIYALTSINLDNVLSGVYLMKVSQGEEMQLVKINKMN